MGLLWASPNGQLVYIPHYWRVYMLLSTFDPYGSYMGVPIWAWPYRTITQGAHIGLLSEPHMGPYGSAHMGLTECDLYGRAHMGKLVCIPHWAHMGLLSVPNIGPLLACPYGPARIYHTRGPYGIAIWVM